MMREIINQRQMKLKNKIFLILIFLLIAESVYSAGMDFVYKYGWGENIGWVNFNPTNGNVDVSDTKITGYAWSENYGWINFSPTNGGVLNDGQGNLSGYAWGEGLGWIDFSNVKIDPNTGDFSGYALILNNGSKINFDCVNCKVKTNWRKQAQQTPTTSQPYSSSYSSSGYFQKLTSFIPQTTNFLEEIKEALLKLERGISGAISKVASLPKFKLFEKPTENKIFEKPPFVFREKWNLLSYTILNKKLIEFNLSPLPKEIKKLAEKFPTIEKTFKEVGISKLLDVQKLKPVKFVLPGLTQRLELPKISVKANPFLLKDVPISELPPNIKEKIPEEVVFVRSINENIDFNVFLNIDNKGKYEQKANFVAGQLVKLVIKPEKPTQSIKGYIVFKSKKLEKTSFEIPRESLLSSLFFTTPVFAESLEKDISLEKKLVLIEFEYRDDDKDGIWTAEVQMPKVEGEYEIITVIDYEDVKKAVQLIVVVDPEGYVYERYGDKEIRIPGAVVSLFWLNPETKKYEPWPAQEYSQENPQITDITGRYAFLVPSGYYYLKAEAPGYLIYTSKPFYVERGSGIHLNIELKYKYWWLKAIDWKVVLLIIVLILIIYNFYRDKIREELINKKQQ
jgi:hypothetical protein